MEYTNQPKLADEQFNKSRRIDLLIGTEYFFDLLMIGQIKLGQNLPLLQKTQLGWVVSGKYKQLTNHKVAQVCLMSVEQIIDSNLERLWRLDEEPSKPNPYTPAQQECEEFFLKTVSRNSEGRVIVRLPFKDNASTLGHSRDIAMRRWLAQERRLTSQQSLRNPYNEFMEEFEQLQHMELVPNPKLANPHFYTPHHCVLKPTSTSTHLRVVFDASCKSTTQVSLNDILKVGPTIQETLVNLLIRFRLHRYAISADIIKMFRQILIHPDDRPFQYILWRNNPTDEVRTYQINTVAYGTAAAPYLAIRALHYLADVSAKQYPIGSQVIK